MKRLLIVTSLSLVAAVALPAVASAQITITPVATSSVSSSTTPKRDRTRPYTFTTRGVVTPPPTCSTIGATGCVPLVCTPGVTNPAYCVRPPLVLLCTGTVKVSIKKGSRTLSSVTVALTPSCTYRSRVSLRSRTSRGSLRVHARFSGNAFLLAKSASTTTVRAG